MLDYRTTSLSASITGIFTFVKVLMIASIAKEKEIQKAMH
jgi:hypothetical protein